MLWRPAVLVVLFVWLTVLYAKHYGLGGVLIGICCAGLWASIVRSRWRQRRREGTRDDRP